MVKDSKSETITRYNVNTEYLYRADGVKLRKIYSSKGQENGTDSYLINKAHTEYLDGFQYEASISSGNTLFTASPTQILKFIPTSEGYYNFENNRYIYSYKDHLGNIRLSYFKNTNNSAEVLEENNYYPFGLEHQGYNALAGNPAYRYQYNNKELQTDTGWSDYGARNYMADLGRWSVVDPLAELSRRTSPYNYALNNPVRFIDPDGMKVINGDQASRDEAEKQKNTAQTNFNNQYGGNRDMKKSDFANKSDWKSYKDARNGLESSEKSFTKADARYQHTQQSIDNFKTVDPEGFAKADNLTYKNKAGDVNTLDIVVTTGNASDYGGGLTGAAINPNTGNIIDNQSTTKLSMNVSITSNTLAHEFGHSVTLASDPITYAQEAKANPEQNCQLPANRNSFLSKIAVDWHSPNIQPPLFSF